VSKAAGSGAGMLQAWFHSLHSSFTTRRAAWLTHLIHDELLGDLPGELKAAAELTKCDAWSTIQDCVATLQRI
jgi:hypothetical protein